MRFISNPTEKTTAVTDIMLALVAVAVALVAAAVFVWSGHAGKVRWAREVALPELRELASSKNISTIGSTFAASSRPRAAL